MIRSDSCSHIIEGSLEIVSTHEPRGNFHCVLDFDKLSFFKSEESRELVAFYQLTPMTKILTPEGGPIFQLVFGDNDVLSLQAPDNSSALSWTMALRSRNLSALSIDSFTMLGMIGNGCYGKVYLARKNDTQKTYAIKVIPKNHLVECDKLQTVIRERHILAQMSHPFIVSLFYAFQSRTNFYLCLEYIPGGELFTYMRRKGHIPLEEAKFYIAEIALALHHLHTLGIVYRDLKPENVMLGSDGHIKLTDFGLAKELATDSTSTFCGTHEYLAPEIIKHQPYGRDVDWWTLGIFFYEMLFKRTPFSSITQFKLYQKILNKNPVIPDYPNTDVVSLIIGLLQKDPKKRYHFQDIIHHPLFADINFDELLEKKITPPFIPTVKDFTADMVKLVPETSNPPEDFTNTNDDSVIVNNFTYDGDNVFQCTPDFCEPPDVVVELS